MWIKVTIHEKNINTLLSFFTQAKRSLISSVEISSLSSKTRVMIVSIKVNTLSEWSSLKVIKVEIPKNIEMCIYVKSTKNNVKMNIKKYMSR